MAGPDPVLPEAPLGPLLRRIGEIRRVEHLSLLARAGAALAGPIEDDEAVQVIASLLVPDLADGCSVGQLAGGQVAPMVSLHDGVDAERLDTERAALETREPARASGPGGSRLCAPMVLAERVVGVVHVSRGPGRPAFDDEDLLVAGEVARQLALAFDRARTWRTARDAVRARDNMLAVVSHDLRSPIHTIRLGLKLMSRGGPGTLDALDLVQRSVERVERLVEDLRDAGTIEAGRFDVISADEDLGGVVTDVVVALGAQADARGVTLEVFIAPDLVPVPCDRGRVFQVLANLVENALKFTEGTGRVRIEVTRTDAGTRIAVRDTGRGLTHDELAHVFERYWRGHPRTKSGSGLGLFIAKGIVEAHGGRIGVDSAAGAGATFWFTLPDR